MKRIQQGLATTLCIMTITFLITMPFILDSVADPWSDCDGYGNAWKHGFNACIAARDSAADECEPYWDCKSAPWWARAILGTNCYAERDQCDAAKAVADDVCECDNDDDDDNDN